MKATKMFSRGSVRRACLALVAGAATGGLVVEHARADGQFPDPPKLKLTINKSTSLVTLGNDEALSVDVDFYEILSNTPSLVPTSWTSLQDQNKPGFPAGDGSGNGWEEFGKEI